MRKITKAQTVKFVKDAENLLKQYGFKEATKDDKFNCYKWVFNSNKFGKVYFKPDDDNSYIFSIFGMFEDVEKAKDSFLAMNPYSGKLNFHDTNTSEREYKTLLLDLECTLKML